MSAYRTREDEIRSLIGAVITVIAIVSVVGTGMIMVHHKTSNTPMATARDHIRENEQGIRSLLAEAARQDPGA